MSVSVRVSASVSASVSVSVCVCVCRCVYVYVCLCACFATRAPRIAQEGQGFLWWILAGASRKCLLKCSGPFGALRVSRVQVATAESCGAQEALSVLSSGSEALTLGVEAKAAKAVAPQHLLKLLKCVL